MKYDAIIIGGGMSGLAAGIRLAHFGRRVCICEKHTATGGLNSWYRRRGRQYDVGLHAMTNFTLPGVRSAPLNRLLRQLRLDYDALQIRPQLGSAIRFPGCELRFTNDFRDLEAGIAKAFPAEMDGFRKLTAWVQAHDAYTLELREFTPARPLIASFLHNPLLIEMLLCPLLYYGSSTPDDLDQTQFCVMFRSIFLEGFWRPAGGVRPLLELLETRYRESGGELRLKARVKRLLAADGRAAGVELEDGTILDAPVIISSAGYPETLRLCDPAPAVLDPPGDMAFVETILVLDRSPATLGADYSILFYNDSGQCPYRRPADGTAFGSGVICVPENFQNMPVRDNHESDLRVTHLTDYAPWFQLPPDAYRQAKRDLLARQLADLQRFLPLPEKHILAHDLFTPRTIYRYTGRLNGAVYGAPHKVRDGVTPVAGLFICGTDQGFLGIVGALLSGVSIANQHVLRASA